MKYVWAVLACIGLFGLYVFLGLAVFGWSSTSSPFGGVFPQLLLLSAMAAVWRLITKKKAPVVQYEDCKNDGVKPVGDTRPQLCKTTWLKDVRVNRNILVGLAIALALIFLVGAIPALLRKTDWQEVRATRYPPEVLYLNYETLGGRSGLEKGIFAIRHRGQTLMLYKTSAYNYKNETPDKILEGVVSFQTERVSVNTYEKEKDPVVGFPPGIRVPDTQSHFGKSYKWVTRGDLVRACRDAYPGAYDDLTDEVFYELLVAKYPLLTQYIAENLK